jgi:hypothetical protein
MCEACSIFASLIPCTVTRSVIRLKANPVLLRKFAHLLKRPVGRQSHKPKKFYTSFRSRGGRGTRPAGWWRK